jgi:DNA-binding NarL/FixJ family response regulator
VQHDLKVPDGIRALPIGNSTFAPVTGTHAHISRNAVISAAMIDEHSFTRAAITRSLQELCHLLEIMSFGYEPSKTRHNAFETKLFQAKKLCKTCTRSRPVACPPAIAFAGPIAPGMRRDLIMVRKREEGIPSRSVGSSPPSDLPAMVVHAQTGEAHALSNEGDRRSQSTICKTPDRNEAIAIAVIDEHPFTRECITKSLPELCSCLEIAAFAACDDCLRSPRAHDLILYHVHESVAKRDKDQRVATIKKLLEMAPVIVVCDVDCIESILAAFESGARGYIPTASTTVKLAVEIMHLVKAGGTFVPPSSLSARAMNRQRAIPGAVTNPHWTNSQMAVLDRLRLGKTNKIIAHELAISESTVKFHIRNIMKRLNATNRTEVASRAHELEVSGMPATDSEALRTNDRLALADRLATSMA